MNQVNLTERFVQRPENYAWFLGAGASRNSGLPTANDILTDLKLRYYCREENQDISRQDIQSQAVKERIQSFMDSRGFPPQWADEEYTKYFEKIFGNDRERQRKYINGILSEKDVSLSVGNRIMGALMSAEFCRVVFTTNFDTVVEKAVAEIGGKSLSAYHLEGASNAKNALDNEEYPFYCKLHGDFRYESIKNLSEDLENQNAELSTCLTNAGNRFGFIVAGYSGRDDSIMKLFHHILDSQNPFPHGLYWTGIKGSQPHPAVNKLLNDARSKGVDAQYIEIETYDTLMLRLWRNLDKKSMDLDSKVRKSKISKVSIELPPTGLGKNILRLNALPIITLPTDCLSITFKSAKDWDELRSASHKTEHNLIFTKSDSIWCWGKRETVKEFFKDDIDKIAIRNLPLDITVPTNLHVKGFIEEALCVALARGKPLLSRIQRSSAYIIVDPDTQDVGGLDPLFKVIGKTSGIIPGLFALPNPRDTETRPKQVAWAEALRISVDYKNENSWLLIEPDIWVWPPKSRRDAESFLDERRSKRYNQKYNELLDAWIKVIFGTDVRNTEIDVSAYENGNKEENPVFRIGNRTGFSKRLVK